MGDTKDEIQNKRQRVPSYFASRISYLLAWRNVARRKVRLGLTLIALSLAGALFIATFGLKLGLDEAIEILVGEFPYRRGNRLRPAGTQTTNRTRGRGFGRRKQRNRVGRSLGVADARRVYADGRLGSSFILFGVPPTTEISPFANRTGHWLGQATNAGDDAELYINYEAEKLTAGPAMGDELTLKLNGGPERVTRLVGIGFRQFNANAYMPYAAFEQATGTHDQAQRVVVYLTDDTETANNGRLKRPWPRRWLPATRRRACPFCGVAAAGYRDGYKAHYLVVLLMSLAGLTALVGGLGLANTMALNVLERSREIGILRSMGAGAVSCCGGWCWPRGWRLP